MIAFHGNEHSLVNTVNISKASLKKAVNPANLQPGLAYDYFKGYFRSVHDLDDTEVKGSGVIDGFSLDKRDAETFFGFHFHGYLRVPADGMYSFTLTSNDGAVLYIDGQVAVNMDGLHPAQSRTEKVPLQKGCHAISLKYFQEGGTHALNVKWEGPGLPRQAIPPSVLYH